MSPELALVDPRLGTTARSLLAQPPDTLARLGCRRPERGIAEDAIEAARRRITELSEVAPPEPRRELRLVAVVPALAAWCGFALFLADFASST